MSVQIFGAEQAERDPMLSLFKAKDPDEYMKLLDAIGKIADMQSGAAKWQATADLLCKLNPQAREQFTLAAAEAKRKNNNLITKTGASKSGDMRHAATIPTCLFTALFAFDPELKYKLEDRNKEVRKKTIHKLVAAFKGFQVPDVI